MYLFLSLRRSRLLFQGPPMFENRVFSSVESKFPPSLIVTSRGLHREFFMGGGSGPFLEIPETFRVRQTISIKLRVPKGFPEALEPWNFCCGARSPTILLTGTLILFWLWSPEPKHILPGVRGPAFSSLIIRVPRLHWFLNWLLPFRVCLCVLTGIKKQNLRRGQYIIRIYVSISVYNDMQQLI